MAAVSTNKLREMWDIHLKLNGNSIYTRNTYSTSQCSMMARTLVCILYDEEPIVGPHFHSTITLLHFENIFIKFS